MALGTGEGGLVGPGGAARVAVAMDTVEGTSVGVCAVSGAGVAGAAGLSIPLAGRAAASGVSPHPAVRLAKNNGTTTSKRLIELRIRPAREGAAP